MIRPAPPNLPSERAKQTHPFLTYIAAEMPYKSIWRSKDAQHFTLVHRSQRDPLINDPDAPDRVLAPTQRRRGQPVGRKELEDEFRGKERSNIGEAANYGIYYDDTEYDYMQHLRLIAGDYSARRGGADGNDDVDVVMLPGPAVNENNKGRQKAPIQLKDEQLELPPGVFPSAMELPRDWTRGSGKEGGLRLDIDPHLRQALEALDDDAFLARKANRQTSKLWEEGSVNAGPFASFTSIEDADSKGRTDGHDDDDDDPDDGSNDFDALFAEVVASGEHDPNNFNSDEEAWRRQAPGGDDALYLTTGERVKQRLAADGSVDGAEHELSLSERVALFKEGLTPGVNRLGKNSTDEGTPVLATNQSRRVTSSVGSSSIFGDGGAGKKSKPGSKARHAMSFYAPSADGGSTAWSMSSSAIERNAGLQHVDEGFERMEQIYEQDEDPDDDFPDNEGDEDGNGGRFVREDFETILDEFLEKHEVIGGKMWQRLGAPDATPAQKLDILRREVGQAKIHQWLQEKEETIEEINKDLESRIRVVGLSKDKWDVETIQTTKTNVSNHPRLLSSVTSRSSYRPSTLARPGASADSLSNKNVEFESIPKIRVNKRTGVYEIVGWTKQSKLKSDSGSSQASYTNSSLPITLAALSITDAESDDESHSRPSDDSRDGTETEAMYQTHAPRQQTVKRDRNESKEEKRARKEAAKTVKQGRKDEKARRKADFAKERKRQVKIKAGRVQGGGAIIASGGRFA